MELSEVCDGGEGASFQRQFHLFVLNFLPEAELELYHRTRTRLKRFVVRLTFSGVKANAEVALNNIISLTTEGDGEILPESIKLREGVSIVEQVVSQGKEIMQSNLSSAVRRSISQVDSFVDTVDKIVQASEDCYSMKNSELSQLRSSRIHPEMQAGNLLHFYTRCYHPSMTSVVCRP